MEAVESLAERFQVPLEEVEQDDRPKGPPKAVLKDALAKASHLYQFSLLHTLDGHAALDYLYSRGIDLEFIVRFELGYAPRTPQLMQKVLSEQKIAPSILEEVGLMSRGREFFMDRITIPIRDATGAIVGFSARKFRPDTTGGKYINSPETPLFKKSKMLFGLSFSRKTIAKEKKVLIVEGQLDALRLIHTGFTWTVAGQGTAFGEDQAKELIQLGVRQVYLALDGDAAGQEASVKIGNFFQKEGVEVFIVPLPEKSDPDSFLQEKGPDEWNRLLEKKKDYLTFWFDRLATTINLASPAGKNEIVQNMVKRIREWDHPLMVRESLKKVAHLAQIPESMTAVDQEITPQIYIKKSASVTFSDIDPDRILEADLLRWLILMGESDPELVTIAKNNLTFDHFRHPSAKQLFMKYLEAASANTARDLLSLAIDLDQPEHQLFLAEILQKKINREKVRPCFIETVQKILERHWMHQREEIKLKIYSGRCSEEEVLMLAKQFDALKKERPQVISV